MSSADDSPFESLRRDADVRAGAEDLAERDGTIGALARISLDIADGRAPDEDDCEEAGMPTLPKLAEDET